jgi:hypothetical protein
MDYLKIYSAICTKGKETRKLDYYEIHHINPRCLGGNDDLENLTRLTYREHYIAHWLLTKIYKNESKIHYGFLCMIRDPRGNRKLTSRMVETIKRNYTEFKKWHAKIVNPMDSLEARKKASERMKKNNPNKGGESNHTSYPIEIEFNDGSKKKYPFMKDAAAKLTIPYISMKTARRKGLSMKKYGILQIKKIEG